MSQSVTKLAFLFSGQGSQSVGMGSELIASCNHCWELFRAADRALGFSLSDMMLHGPEEKLRETTIAQPAILVLSVAHAWHLMSLGMKPVAFAGHSMGQIAAFVAAGAIDFASAVRLVTERGRLMQQTVPEGGAMMAILDLDREQVYAACAKARSLGVVNVACHNAPGRTVISGMVDAVEAAADYCEEAGGSVAPLAVSAPFHCDLLIPMVSEFTRLVENIKITDPRLPVIDNVTVQPIRDAAAVRQSLIAHITVPVRFEEDLRYMVDRGINRFIQCGPGKALLGFAQRVAAGAGVTVETVPFEEVVPSILPVAAESQQEPHGNWL